MVPRHDGSYSEHVEFNLKGFCTSARTLLVVVSLWLCSIAVAADQSYLITTYAGGQPPLTAAPAVGAVVGRASGVATDGAGNIWFTDSMLHSVFKVDTNGNMTRVAGTGSAGFSGDSGPAVAAQLSHPFALAVDTSGTLYIADSFNGRIRKVDRSGIITTVAGGGADTSDGVPATSSKLNNPQGVLVDSNGNLYFSDYQGHRVRKVNPNGIVSTVAGTGTSGYSGDNGSATAAQLAYPAGIALDGDGNLYISDSHNGRIRKTDSSGNISTIAGPGTGGNFGDNGPATSAFLGSPNGLTLDASGNLYFADFSNSRIRMVTKGGVISTVAGTGTKGLGDGGPATSAALQNPYGVACDSSGLYIADYYNQRVRMVAGGNISTVAGGGVADSGPAVFAGFSKPSAVVKDQFGNLYVADSTNHRVRKITPSGTISTVAGTGSAGYSGEKSAATNAQFNTPSGMALDLSGNLYIADTNNHRIRMIDGAGNVSTVAGTGTAGYSGDGSAATAAKINYPGGLAFDSTGNLYFADGSNHRVRKIDLTGKITTVAGTGISGFNGDGIEATTARLNYPSDVALDSFGNLYIADSYNYRIREVDTNSNISTIAGTGVSGNSGDGTPAIAAQIATVYGIAVDNNNNLFLADTGNSDIREITSSGTMVRLTAAGMAYSGDGGPSTSAHLYNPRGVWVDGSGWIYAADYDNNVIRLLIPTATPLLSVTSSHGGVFHRGSVGQYTITVGNNALAGAANDVGVNVILSAGLNLTGLDGGSSWTCGGTTCTATATLQPGASYPPIAATVAVDLAAPEQVTTQITVSGGGFPTAGVEDLTQVTDTPPGIPVLISPANASYNVALTAALNWTSATLATSYDLYFGTAQAPPFLMNTAALTYSPAALSSGTTYYWYVAARHGTASTPSSTWSFTTAPAGTCTYTISPANVTFTAAGGAGAITVNTQPGCYWSATGNGWVTINSGGSGLGTGAVNYTVASTTTGGRSYSFQIGGQTATIVEMPAQGFLINTLSGAQAPPVIMPALSAPVSFPVGVVADSTGNVYFQDGWLNIVYRVDSQGKLTRVAGTGVPGYSGDGIPAITAQLNLYGNMARDAAGNLYVADSGGSRVRKIATDGNIYTVAGTGVAGYSGDNGPATAAQVYGPIAVAVDATGNVYIADEFNNRIRMVSTSGTISTVAGNGAKGYGGDGAPATAAQLQRPQGIAVDSHGNLFIADTTNQRIRKVTTDGNIATIAGTGTSGYSGDGGAATSAKLASPQGIAVDSAGSVYFADTNNNRIRRISGVNISTVAGNGALSFSGDGGPATSAGLGRPIGVAIDANGVLYIADTYNQRVRKVSAGVIGTIAGGGVADGGPAAFGLTNEPYGAVKDANGNLYVVEARGHRVRKITPSGTLSTFAGTGVPGYAGDGGQATSAQLNWPQGLVLDGSGNLYIADTGNNRVRKVTPAGIITTFAGTGVYGYSGDDGPATSAKLADPTAVAVNSQGNVYIADSDNNRIRMVSTSGAITTVAGNGTEGFAGDGQAATSAKISYPKAIALDNAGNLYIADANNYRVRMVSKAGTINTVAGNGTSGNSGDNGPATSAQLNYPGGVAVDPAGNIYIADSYSNRIRLVNTSGTIYTVAGGSGATLGDGGPANLSYLSDPVNISIDGAGVVYIADSGDNLVRTLTPVGTAPVLTVTSSHAGMLTPGASGQFTLTVSNAALAGATSGTIAVTDIAPAGLTITSMGGSGWTCNLPNCTSSAVVASGASYPDITVGFSVGDSIAAQVTNQVAVSGGGGLPTGAEDFVLTAPALSISLTHCGTLIAGLSSSAYTITVRSTGIGTTVGTVGVQETVPVGLTLVSMSGQGWNCTSGSTLCTRSDPLPAGAIYPPVTVRVSVAGDAPSSVTSQASTGGGGAPTVTVSDVTAIAPANTPDLSGGGVVDVSSLQSILNEVLGLSPAIHDLTGDGQLSVADIQKLIELCLGRV